MGISLVLMYFNKNLEKGQSTYDVCTERERGSLKSILYVLRQLSMVIVGCMNLWTMGTRRKN